MNVKMIHLYVSKGVRYDKRKTMNLPSQKRSLRISFEALTTLDLPMSHFANV